MEVSVIVPTYGRPDRLAACLRALGAQEGVPCEVVVVDDGSEPPVRDVVAQAQAQAQAQNGAEAQPAVPMRYLRQANAGPASARNRGAGAARGALLAFTDDDCRPEPGWLAALLAASRAAPDALLGGHTVNGLPGNVYAAASQDLIGFLEAEDRTYFASNNLACRADRFAASGGFEESFPLAGGEDREFGLRWGGQGRPLVHVPDAVVHHHHGLTARTFWRQHANYGRGARHLRARGGEGQGAAPAHRFGSLLWYGRLVSYPLRTGQPRGLRRAGLLAAAQLATAWGFATPPRAGRGAP